jgi:hypothetical protein
VDAIIEEGDRNDLKEKLTSKKNLPKFLKISGPHWNIYCWEKEQYWKSGSSFSEN